MLAPNLLAGTDLQMPTAKPVLQGGAERMVRKLLC
jgi:hypothetical protein